MCSKLEHNALHKWIWLDRFYFLQYNFLSSFSVTCSMRISKSLSRKKGCEVTSPALVVLNAFWIALTFQKKV